MACAPLRAHAGTHTHTFRNSNSWATQGQSQGRALYGPMPVKTETFRELWATLVLTNFRGNSCGPIIGPYLFLGKFVWTNGPESSSKVSPQWHWSMDGSSQRVQSALASLNRERKISPKFAIVATSYRECQALRAQNAEKVSKRSFRTCRPGVPKKRRKSLKSHEKVSLWHFFVTF